MQRTLTAHLFLYLLGGIQPVLKDRSKKITLGRLETQLMHVSMSHFALIAISVANESFSIWLHRETELVPTESLARSESRFNSTICFFIVLQIYWQPVIYVSDLITSQWCLLLYSFIRRAADSASCSKLGFSYNTSLKLLRGWPHSRWWAEEWRAYPQSSSYNPLLRLPHP